MSAYVRAACVNSKLLSFYSIQRSVSIVVKTMKRSVGLMMFALVLMLAMAASAFANPYNSYNYYFEYDGAYHAHSSSYISANATESGGNVTLKLTGNYFPEVKVGGVTYTGVYHSSTNTTTITFPGSISAPVELSLHVVVAPHHDTWYPLTIVWG